MDRTVNRITISYLKRIAFPRNTSAPRQVTDTEIDSVRAAEYVSGGDNVGSARNRLVEPGQSQVRVSPMKSPIELGLSHPSWRPGQQLAIRTALHAKTKHIVIQAPTGAGKTAIALGLSRLTRRRVAILTSTKGLQQQYLREDEMLIDIRGMANYECLAARDEFVRFFPYKGRRTVQCDDGPCRAEMSCTLKESGCLYFDAYRRALAARVILTNYDYWVSSRRFSKGLGTVDYLICDEAHDCPDKLMSACKVEVSLNEVDGRRLPKTLSQWHQWAASRLDQVKRETQDTDARIKRRRLMENLEAIMRMDREWAFELRDDRAIFEPTIPRHLSRLLFDTNTTVIFLSATITDTSVSSVLDIPESDVTFLALQSRFPKSRRPVYLVKTCRVDHRMTREDRVYWLERVDQVIDSRTDRKGIIHTVSYARQAEILDGSRHRGMMLAPRRASELADAVDHFKRSREPLILISPSITTGFDFPGDQCRYNIVTKVPFPDTRSAIMKARIKATPSYRAYLTIQSLVQACGRGMRSEDDWCETFIMDDNSGWFLYHEQELAPRWFLDSLVRTGRVPHGPDTATMTRQLLTKE